MPQLMHTITVRIDTPTLRRLDRLTRHHQPSPKPVQSRYLPFTCNRSALLRIAINLGLDHIKSPQPQPLTEIPPCPTSNPALLPTLAGLDTASSARLRLIHSEPS